MIRGVAIVWLGTFGSMLITFATQIILARVLSIEEYGLFSSLFVITVLAGAITGFGINDTLIKKYGELSFQAWPWVKPLGILSGVIMLIAFMIVLLWACLGPHGKDYRSALLLMSFSIMAQQMINVVSAVYQIEEKFGSYSIVQLFQGALRLFLIILMAVLAEKINIISVAAVYFVSALCVIAVMSRVAWGHFWKMHLNFNKEGYLEGGIPVIRGFCEAWPYGLAVILHLIYFQLPIALIAYLVDETSAAYYSVAFNILGAILVLPSVIYQKVLIPRLHRVMSSAEPARLLIYNSGNGAMLALGMATLLLGAVLGTPFIEIVFGPQYSPAGEILFLLLFTVPIRFLSSSVGAFLVTGNLMKKKVAFMSLVAASSLSLNSIILPVYGAIGAAWVAIFNEVLLFIAYGYLSKKYVYGKVFWKGWFDYKQLIGRSPR